MVAVRMAPSGAPGFGLPTGLLTCVQLPPFRIAAGRLQLPLQEDSMFKVTPNPPETDPASPYESLDSKKLHEAAERALDHYLIPPKTSSPPYQTSSMFQVNPSTDTESLLVNASESLGSASVMLGDFAALLDGSQRKTLLGIAQVVMLGELAVNQVFDNVVPVG